MNQYLPAFLRRLAQLPAELDPGLDLGCAFAEAPGVPSVEAIFGIALTGSAGCLPWSVLTQFLCAVSARKHSWEESLRRMDRVVFLLFLVGHCFDNAVGGLTSRKSARVHDCYLS